VRYIVSMLLICGAVATAVVLYLTTPKTKKESPVRSSPIVATTTLTRTSEPVIIEAYGTVMPARELTVQAQVEGRIIHQNANLVLGGLIPAKSILLQIDPKDYQLAIKQQESLLEETRFDVEMEEGRRVIAEREWKLLEEEIATTEAGRKLALRQPHEKRAEARFQAADSRLQQARLDETRTTLTCPFNALVQAESIEKTQLVSSQTKLATLVGTDQFWVQVSVPLGRLPRIVFPRGDRKGSPVKVILDMGNGMSVVRKGRVLRLLGGLEPGGRMARVLVAVDNPLDLLPPTDAETASKAPMAMGPRCLLLGCYVKVEIDAGLQDNVYVVPRSAVREGDRLWLVGDEGRLVFRDVEILWRRRDEVLVRCEIAADEQLVLSRLSAPLPGMKVRTQDQQTATSAPTTAPATAPARTADPTEGT